MKKILILSVAVLMTALNFSLSRADDSTPPVGPAGAGTSGTGTGSAGGGGHGSDGGARGTPLDGSTNHSTPMTPPTSSGQ